MAGNSEKKTYVPSPLLEEAARRLRMKDIVEKDFELSISIIRNIKLAIKAEIELVNDHIYLHSLEYLIIEAEKLIDNLKNDYEDIVCLGGFDQSFSEASKILGIK